MNPIKWLEYFTSILAGLLSGSALESGDHIWAAVFFIGSLANAMIALTYDKRRADDEGAF